MSPVSILSRRPWLRWGVPAGVLLAVMAVSGATRLLAAEPALPEISASELLVKMQQSEVRSLSGTVSEKADLGLPPLPTDNRGGGSDLSALADGSNTLKVWYDGPQRYRLAVLGTLGESDVIRNGRDLWTWRSQDSTATHTTLPAGETGQPASSPPDPRQMANRVLAALDPTTKVSVEGTATVAGRAAYELVAVPREAGSLVRQVRIAVDGTRYVPLRVQVYAAGQDAPALQAAYTQISFARPDANQLRFVPPPGAKVTEKPAEQPGRAKPAARPVVVGQGWTAVLVTRLPSGDRNSAMLSALPRAHGDWGSGRLVQTKLFTALITDDGRLLVGAVPPQQVYAAASDPAAQLPAPR